MEYNFMITFAALSDPVRRDIVSLLQHGESSAGTLVDRLALPQPNVSKHLKILREAGLVKVRVDGPSRIYSLDPAPLAKLDEWLAPFRNFWADKLDSLGDHLSRSD
jgi:DNA-binding transcriptional ArsR family regulator